MTSPESELSDPGESKEIEDGEPVGEASSLPDSPGDGADLPGPVEAVLEEIPPDQREKVRSMFLGLSQYVGPVPNPLLGKLTDSHLDKIIDGAANENKRSFEDRDKGRSHVKVLAIGGMVTFLVASGLFLWTQQSDLLQFLVQVAVVFAGGIGVGAGYRRT